MARKASFAIASVCWDYSRLSALNPKLRWYVFGRCTCELCRSLRLGVSKLYCTD